MYAPKFAHQSDGLRKSTRKRNVLNEYRELLNSMVRSKSFEGLFYTEPIVVLETNRMSQKRKAFIEFEYQHPTTKKMGYFVHYFPDLEANSEEDLKTLLEYAKKYSYNLSQGLNPFDLILAAK
jgi:hypothetical protein